MTRTVVLIYGVVIYVLFLATFLYAIGFVGNLLVPKQIDSGEAGNMNTAILINVALLGIFGIQHTIMARAGFKRFLTQTIPQPAERSTFVLFTCIVMGLMYWQWRPMDQIVWEVTGPVAVVLWGVFALGWAIVLISTYIIDHFDLFGLKQVIFFYRQVPYPDPKFKVVSFYRFVRHPLLLGFMIAFWAAPVMTVSRLVFAGVSTVYMLVAIQIEERDLVASHGEEYENYRRRVPMIIPFLKGKG